LFIAAIIVQIKRNKIQRILKPFLPKTKIDKFVKQYQMLQIKSRIIVEEKLGSGTWSNVYRGNQQMLHNVIKSITRKYN
jgi:hypothetical protein